MHVSNWTWTYGSRNPPDIVWFIIQYIIFSLQTTLFECIHSGLIEIIVHYKNTKLPKISFKSSFWKNKRGNWQRIYFKSIHETAKRNLPILLKSKITITSAELPYHIKNRYRSLYTGSAIKYVVLVKTNLCLE